MKTYLRILVVISLLATPKILFGQFFTLYSEVGYKGSIGNTIISNDLIRNDNQITEENRSGYSSHGFKASISYIGAKPMYTIFGIHMDFMQATFTKNFSDISTDNETYSKEINYKSSNTTLTFRYTNANYRVFFEAGTMITSIKSVSENNSIISPDFFSSNSLYNLKDHYQQYNSFVIGTGAQFRYFTLGFRIINSLGSMLKTDYYQVSDGFFNNPLHNTNYHTHYLHWNETSSFTYEFSLSCYIPFFSVGKASCGNRSNSFFRKVNENYYWGGGW